MNYARTLKKTIESLIHSMEENKQDFVQSPEKDFTRVKKWSFSNVMQFMLELESHTMKQELLEFFDYSTDTPSVSSIVQRRAQIKTEAFQHLFHSFTEEALPETKSDIPYHCLAIDGSGLLCCYDPDNPLTHVKQKNGCGFNKLHLNGLYDLDQKLYLDAVIQPVHQKNEHLAAQEMIDHFKLYTNALFMMDRGYGCYNTMAKIEQKGMFYLIRGKDIDSSGSSIAASVRDQLPDTECFDTWVKFYLTKKRTKDVKAKPELYKRIRKNQTFDYLTTDNPYYEMNLRIVRFKLKDGSYECILTNLPEDKVSTDMMKELYFRRWGIETSFRELKYAVGLACFHSKKDEFVLQEIWMRLLMYNYCELITSKIAGQMDCSKEKCQHKYQLNYTNAIHLCRKYFRRKKEESLFDIEELIKKELLPIRPDRSNPRKVAGRSFISFLYRIA